jgi:3-oxoadipate enol-lactonase
LQIHSSNVTLNIQESGQGNPTLVFLHYWGGSIRTWQRVIQPLSRKFRCIAYDHRGWGESAGSANGYDLAQLADDAEAVIHQLDLHDYVLVGHSMGGKVAQLLASRKPQGLKSLILVAPAPPTPQQIPEEAHQIQIHAYDNRQNVEEAIAFLTSSGLSPNLHEQVIEDSLRGSPEAKHFWPNVGAYEDISDRLKYISVPALVIAGEHDRQDPVEQHQREVVARIAGSQLEIIQNAGHLLPLESPEAVAQKIDEFVKRVR